MCQCLVCGKTFPCNEGDGTHWDRRAECCEKPIVVGEIKHCEWCNVELKGEEIDAPMIYKGDKICDSCYAEKSFSCILCEETMDDQNITHIMVNIGDVGVSKGYYEVINRPFISGDCLGIDIKVIPSSVKKVKELNGNESEGADCICPECSNTVSHTGVGNEVRQDG